jgi:hypothetical protein
MCTKEYQVLAWRDDKIMMESPRTRIYVEVKSSNRLSPWWDARASTPLLEDSPIPQVNESFGYSSKS